MLVKIPSERMMIIITDKWIFIIIKQKKILCVTIERVTMDVYQHICLMRIVLGIC